MKIHIQQLNTIKRLVAVSFEGVLFCGWVTDVYTLSGKTTLQGVCCRILLTLTLLLLCLNVACSRCTRETKILTFVS